MSTPEYYSTQLLTTTINIEPNQIKGDINKLILHTIQRKYEGVCNKDGYIENGSIELINRSIGEVTIIDNNSYITYRITYKAIVISPSEGLTIKCIISSSNKMGLIGYVQKNDSDTIEDSPFIIIVPTDYINSSDMSTFNIGDSLDVSIVNFRIRYLATQIQIVAKPV